LKRKRRDTADSKRIYRWLALQSTGIRADWRSIRGFADLAFQWAGFGGGVDDGDAQSQRVMMQDEYMLRYAEALLGDGVGRSGDATEGNSFRETGEDAQRVLRTPQERVRKSKQWRLF
jgi:hypothetical protein